MKRKRMRITGLLIVFFLLFFLAGAVIYGLGARSGKIIPNHPSETKYPVRGVDVSSYQGEIDWQVLASQGIRFAFIKATEGSGFVDPCFSRNMADALGTDLKVGAYHFFSYDSGGETQVLWEKADPVCHGSVLPPVYCRRIRGISDLDPERLYSSGHTAPGKEMDILAIYRPYGTRWIFRGGTVY